MDFERLRMNYPQVDMEHPHRLHIKVSAEEKAVLAGLSAKLQTSESRICVEAIIAQIPILEESIIDYKMKDFSRKNGGYSCDIDIFIPPELFLRLLFYKETFQSFSLGLLIRMMIDRHLDGVNINESEEDICRNAEIRKEQRVSAHAAFLNAKAAIGQICECIISRLTKFPAGLSEEMLCYWNALVGV